MQAAARQSEDTQVAIWQQLCQKLQSNRALSRRSLVQLLLCMCMLHGYGIYLQICAACGFPQVQSFRQKAAAAALAATLFTGWTGLDAGLVPPSHANEEGNMSPSERRKMQMQKRKQLLSEA